MLADIESDIDNQILDLLKNLPVKYMDVFLLKYSAQLKNREIAEICGIKEVTVRQRIAMGKALLEDALRNPEDDLYDKEN
jgi:RNA polymerase sigma-70 factor (ECF subfamily)